MRKTSAPISDTNTYTQPVLVFCLWAQVIYTYFCLSERNHRRSISKLSYYFTCCANRFIWYERVHWGTLKKNVVLVSSQTYHTMSGRRFKTFGCGCLSVLNGDRTTVHASISSVDSSIGCDAVFSSGFFIMFRSMEIWIKQINLFFHFNKIRIVEETLKWKGKRNGNKNPNIIFGTDNYYCICLEYH